MSTVRVYGTFVGPSPEFFDLPFDESVVLDAYEYTLQGEHLKRVRFGTADTIHVNHPWNGRRTVKFLEKSNMHTHSHTHTHTHPKRRTIFTQTIGAHMELKQQRMRKIKEN